ncbi:uroporphyrinogen-III C-methyltransferase [Moraxella caviae]|uniref:Siroheme synthase n=1 Tax=Moraxella caviae TaxID=34060 RepID=A0A1T0A4F7_9GAMM|nr:siroheme synthase CysG [Moraxella caviae]OOR90692.1 uroporphyrinogen-III C-methyltransferase [Moraxella caviae]STZ14837.1 Siroheme synthase [Moraxella caviae]VEW11270.1 Siroheme synthase [Moraxella caviae]
MNTLPLFFDLQDKTVLIIGGGEVAMRKASLLERAGARLVVLAEAFNDDVAALGERHTLVQKSYEAADLSRFGALAFIIVATDNHALNVRIHQDAKALGVAVNVVDTPDLCDFIFPAIVDRSPVVIGVSSNGKAPVLARLIRAKIESSLPSGIGALAKKAGEFRAVVKDKLPTINERRHFWERVFGKALNDTKVAALPDELNDFIANDNTKTGEVYIVGAGAGDPDLLTFKALRLMQQADVVLYDALVSDEILDLCRRDSDKIFVGKKRSNHSKSQDEINALLVELAKQGKRVLRLKGGDPFVFGRGGEEMLACQKAGVPYQVVSGITSALAASSYAGIPLTQRGVATSVRFLTGCYQTNEAFDGLKSAYQPDETLVFYMGLHALDKIVASLLSSGLPSDTPIAIVANASLPTQQVLKGTLDDIVAKRHASDISAPAIIIVGKVVDLHQT